MERKDYELQISEVKNEILHEIIDTLGSGSRHDFNEKFYVHYVEGEVATTEICNAVEVSNDGQVTFITFRESSAIEEKNEGEFVFLFEPNSFIDILCNLKKELREEKLTRLRNIIKNAGGKVNVDGSFGFHSIVDGDHVAGKKSFLTRIEIDRTYENRVYLVCIFNGEIVEEQEENIPFDQLDSLIAYVESQTKKKTFTVKVSGSFSRCFDIEATNEEEAEKLAKAEWLANPLCSDDSNGENWDCCQHNLN